MGAGQGRPSSAARYQQAVRAANIIELFTAQGANLFNLAHDPCAGNVPGQAVPTATLAQCVATGLNPAQYGTRILDNVARSVQLPAGRQPERSSPETAKKLDAGPRARSRSRTSLRRVDYWNIDVQNQIGIVPSSLAITQCIATGQFCDLIHRDAQGTLWLPNGGFVTGHQHVNLGARRPRASTVAVNYIWDMPSYGSLGFQFVGTWLHEFITEPVPGLGSYDCAGLFGATCGTPLPEWRHKFRVLWTTPVERDGRADMALLQRRSISMRAARIRSLPRRSCRRARISRRKITSTSRGVVEHRQELDDPRRCQQRLRPGSAAHVVDGRRPAVRQRQHVSAGLRHARTEFLPEHLGEVLIGRFMQHSTASFGSPFWVVVCGAATG